MPDTFHKKTVPRREFIHRLGVMAGGCVLGSVARAARGADAAGRSSPER